MRKFLRPVLLNLWLVVTLTPIVVYFVNRGSNFRFDAQSLFPLFGLIAFLLIWTQIIIGAFLSPLAKLFPKLLSFHITQGLIALLFALLHPLFLIISLESPLKDYFDYSFIDSQQLWAVSFGQLALWLLLAGILAGLFRRWRPIVQYWRTIHLLNYLVFILVFFHSLSLGSDVQASTLLQVIWIGLFVSVVIALVYRRVTLPAKIGLEHAR